MSYESIWKDLQGVAFEQGYLDAGGIRTRYLMTGAEHEDVLIFLHGFGGHAEAYVRNLEAHGKHFRTYSIDMVGHGYSSKPDVKYDIPVYTRHLLDVIDAIGADAVSISGESLGGWVAGQFAIAYPERVKKLVLNTMGGATMDLAVLKTLKESTIAAAENPGESMRPRLEWLMADPSRVHDDLVASRTQIYQRADTLQAVKNGTVLYEEDTRRRRLMNDETCAKIQAPTLVLWTTKDPSAKPEVGERVAEAIPNAQYVLMNDCGHWPQFEDSATFNKLHIDYLLS